MHEQQLVEEVAGGGAAIQLGQGQQVLIAQGQPVEVLTGHLLLQAGQVELHPALALLEGQFPEAHLAHEHLCSRCLYGGDGPGRQTRVVGQPPEQHLGVEQQAFHCSGASKLAAMAMAWRMAPGAWAALGLGTQALRRATGLPALAIHISSPCST